MKPNILKIDIAQFPIDCSPFPYDSIHLKYHFLWEGKTVTPIMLTLNNQDQYIGYLCLVETKELIPLHLITFNKFDSIDIVEKAEFEISSSEFLAIQELRKKYFIEQDSKLSNEQFLNKYANRYLLDGSSKLAYLKANYLDKCSIVQDCFIANNVLSSGLPFHIQEHINPLIARFNHPATPIQEKQALEDYLNVINSIRFNCVLPVNTDTLQMALDESHHNLLEQKRILLNIANIYKEKNLFNRCLTFLGPPGTGKTSLIKTMANNIGLKVVPIPLAGVKDVSHLLGFARSYVRSAPGKIVNGLITSKCMNPIIIFDEIDKASDEIQNVLLHILDPDNKEWFVDHFLGVGIDLSKVLFFATANDLNCIIEPLRDRLLIAEIPSYTQEQKETIIKTRLINKIANDLNIKFNITDSYIVSLSKLDSIRDIEKTIYYDILSKYGNKDLILENNSNSKAITKLGF